MGELGACGEKDVVMHVDAQGMRAGVALGSGGKRLFIGGKERDG